MTGRGSQLHSAQLRDRQLPLIPKVDAGRVTRKLKRATSSKVSKLKGRVISVQSATAAKSEITLICIEE